MGKFMVTCLDDDGTEVIATRKRFDTLNEAYSYAGPIAFSRCAKVWHAVIELPHEGAWNKQQQQEEEKT
jgi:hypothetical protein